jgi:hypothetical protein
LKRRFGIVDLREEWIMGRLKRWLTERKANKYVRKTPEEEYAIYKRRLLSGESDISARAGLKHLKKK